MSQAKPSLLLLLLTCHLSKTTAVFRFSVNITLNRDYRRSTKKMVLAAEGMGMFSTSSRPVSKHPEPNTKAGTT